jgi:hypothetical protein
MTDKDVLVIIRKVSYMYHFRCVLKISKNYCYLRDVRPCICMEQRFPLDGFSWNLVFEYFSKNCRANSSFFKTWQEWRVLYMKTNIHFWSHPSKFFLEWEMFQTKFVEKIKTHFVFNFFFFRKSCLLLDNVEKYCSRAGHRWQYGAWELHAGYLRVQTHTQNT